ncbi:hypothetical protein [Bacillus sp. Marseille-P3661]|uniref:hypothetical protein n=1 Tax=Bacillus sp. Marseille-P3661 TaxID=1936234 RepID=UPI000C843D6A|nr:hypothetical protein [Bacillus sp. Marseille-P3661]
MYRQSPQPIIGTAWFGHHIVVLLCNPFNNELISLEKSLEAPIEPAHPTCSETLSRLMSIGYKIENALMIAPTVIQYILVKN